MNADQITALYQQYLGRSPSQDEINGWLTGQYGSDPASQIPASGEAQAYASRTQQPTSSPNPPATGIPIDTTGGVSENPNVTLPPAPGQPGPTNIGNPTGVINTSPGMPGSGWRVTPSGQWIDPNGNPSNISAWFGQATQDPANRQTAIANAYQMYLGRPMTDAEYQQYWANNGNSVQSIIQQISQSGEAQAYRGTGGQKIDNGAGGQTTVPSYVNMNDPASAAVWKAFQTKGIQPRDQGDFQYWVDKINQTGGWGNQDNQNYWLSRMAQAQGGVGDYGGAPEGGGVGGPGLQANTPGGGGAGGGSPLGDQGALASYFTNSPLLAPWTQTFNYQNWKPPVQYTPIAPFQAPTGVTEQNDPGYQFRLQQGQQALERSAAAKGTLLTGGTLRDVQDYAQGLASNEYQNVYNRALTGWQTNYQQNLGDYQTQYNSSLNDWTTNYNKALQGYQTAYNVFEQNQAKQFNRIADLMGAGQTAAGNLGQQGLGYAGLGANTAMGFGGSLANLYTGAGAAQAAGAVGSANAWQGALSGIGNYAMAYPYLQGINSSAYTRG